MRLVTAEIIAKIHERTQIATKIGQLKRKLDLDIRDEKAARDMRDLVLDVAKEKGLRKDFAIQILNVLLIQSELIQGTSRVKPTKPTHLSMFARAKQLEQSGKKIVHMEVGEPDYAVPDSVGVALSDAFRKRNYRYTATEGVAALRTAIAKREQVPVDDVMVTPGGRFAVFSIIAGLLHPGDELLTFEPAWPAYRECANYASVAANVVKTRFDDGWVPSISAIEEGLTPNTKMIVINYPNNPTGIILPQGLMEEIVQLAAERDIYILSDEVYSHYARAPFKSLKTFGYNKGIVVQSFSKTYAMTGFRVGYVVCKNNIIESIRRIQSLAITSVAEPVQYAALAALSEDPQENASSMFDRLDYACSRLEKMPVRFRRPDGAMYVFPELLDVEDTPFVESMLQNGVAVAPGSGFGESYSKFVRISACVPKQILAEGFDIMSRTLASMGKG
jgi:aspartate aminotransferase